MASRDSLSTASRSSRDRDFGIKCILVEDAAAAGPSWSANIFGDPRKGSVDSFRTIDGEVEDVRTPRGDKVRPIGGERARPIDGERAPPTVDAPEGESRSRGRT